MDQISHLPINVLDIGAIALLLLSALFAYARGFVREVFSIIGWVGAVFVTFYSFPYVIPYRRKLIPIEIIADLATGSIIFIFTLALLTIITKNISKIRMIFIHYFLEILIHLMILF